MQLEVELAEFELDLSPQLEYSQNELDLFALYVAVLGKDVATIYAQVF